MSIEFLSKIVAIILFDIVLSGDNAVVIALATRKLDEGNRKKAIFVGTAGAIILRVVLMMMAVQLLALPFIKIIGSLLLLYIAYDLLKSNDSEEHGNVKVETSFFAAVRTILVADLVMSLDNVIAIAGASDGHAGLAVLGLIVSIPVIVFGSQIILKIMDKFPIVIWVGALLIAYTAGTMIIEDHFFAHLVDRLVPNISHTHMVPIVFALLLIAIKFVIEGIKGKNKELAS